MSFPPRGQGRTAARRRIAGRLAGCVAALAAAGILHAAGASAAPIQVAYSSVAHDTLETFESFPDPTPGSSAAFNGFTATADKLQVKLDSGACGRFASTCLFDLDGGQSVTFSDFDPGTNFFGFHFNEAGSGNSFEVGVSGLRHTVTFTIDEDGDYGFSDIDGLTSVRVSNTAKFDIGQFSFDDVVTSSPDSGGGDGETELPAPSSILLLAAGLLGLVRLRRNV